MKASIQNYHLFEFILHRSLKKPGGRKASNVLDNLQAIRSTVEITSFRLRRFNYRTCSSFDLGKSKTLNEQSIPRVQSMHPTANSL
jgi:hypothetical protein